MQQMQSYCLLIMFRAPLCPLSGARDYYTGGCCLWYLVLWFSSCRYDVDLWVMFPVCGLRAARKSSNLYSFVIWINYASAGLHICSFSDNRYKIKNCNLELDFNRSSIKYMKFENKRHTVTIHTFHFITYVLRR
jgi:hypothetical protein